MTEPTLNYVPCADPEGGHRMAYWQWGAPDAGHTVVCVHGLSRQGRDFDVLARRIVATSRQSIRVICPDVVGRGRSDWLKNPAGYQVPTYVADMITLLGQLHQAWPIQTLDWVGTSMGGLIGMGLLGTPGLPLPVAARRLVLNDVGPAIEWSAVERIGAYVGQTGHYETVQQAADAMWAVSASFGPHTPQEWLALSTPMIKPVPGGGWTLHYDPAIATPFRSLSPETAAQGQTALWAAYDSIRAETLLLRGAQSDLLSIQTAQAMTQRGPRARLVEFEGIGHAPTLVADEQTAVVVDFLLH